MVLADGVVLCIAMANLLESLPSSPSIQQAADALGVSYNTIRRRIADGSLRAYRVGPRVIRVDRDSLIELARSQVIA
jgi:excisionase family DNA binding protein